MIEASKRHLEEVDESYGEHLATALAIAGLMLRAGAACALHALVPGLCTRTASRCLARVQARFDGRAATDHRLPQPPGPLLSR